MRWWVVHHGVQLNNSEADQKIFLYTHATEVKAAWQTRGWMVGEHNVPRKVNGRFPSDAMWAGS